MTYPMVEGECSAGRFVIDPGVSGWDTPCPELAVYTVDVGQGAEGYFCHVHINELLEDGLAPESVRQPVCVAGVLIVHESNPRWSTPCGIEGLEIIAMTLNNGRRVPVWFCEGHFHEFKLMVGPDKLTRHPTGA